MSHFLRRVFSWNSNPGEAVLGKNEKAMLLEKVGVFVEQGKPGLAFFTAVWGNDLNIVNDFIKQGIDVKKISQIPSIGLLNLAVTNNSSKMLSTLLEAGADPNVVEIKKKKVGELQRPKLKNTDGQAPIHLAVEEGSVKLVKILLNHGADINLVNCKTPQNDFRTELDVTAFEVESVLQLPLGRLNERSGKLIDEESFNTSQAALHISLQRENLPLVEFLIKKGANVNQYDGWGNTPLHIAAKNKSSRFAKVLLAHPKIDLYSLQTHEQSTPLDVAIKYKNSAVIDLLSQAIQRKVIRKQSNFDNGLS